MNELDHEERFSILGLTVSITTIHDDVFTGDVFYYSPENRILIISMCQKIIIIHQIGLL